MMFAPVILTSRVGVGRDWFGKVCAPAKAALGLVAAFPAGKERSSTCVFARGDIDTEDYSRHGKNYSTPNW